MAIHSFRAAHALRQLEPEVTHQLRHTGIVNDAGQRSADALPGPCTHTPMTAIKLSIPRVSVFTLAAMVRSLHSAALQEYAECLQRLLHLYLLLLTHLRMQGIDAMPPRFQGGICVMQTICILP